VTSVSLQSLLVNAPGWDLRVVPNRFPALQVELLNPRGQRRLVRIDPLAGVPVVEIP